MLSAEKAEAERLSVEGDLAINATHEQRVAAHAQKAADMLAAYEAKVTAHNAKMDGINAEHSVAREANVDHWQDHFDHVKSEFKADFEEWARDSKNGFDAVMARWQTEGVADDHAEEAVEVVPADVPETETTGDTSEEAPVA